MNLALDIQPALRERTALFAVGRQAPSRFNRYLLNVDFASADGAEWSSVGGGESVPEAIAAAREALPPGAWTVARWNDVYGE